MYQRYFKLCCLIFSFLSIILSIIAISLPEWIKVCEDLIFTRQQPAQQICFKQGLFAVHSTLPALKQVISIPYKFTTSSIIATSTLLIAGSVLMVVGIAILTYTFFQKENEKNKFILTISFLCFLIAGSSTLGCPITFTAYQQEYVNDPMLFKQQMVELVSKIYADAYGSTNNSLAAGIPLPIECQCGGGGLMIDLEAMAECESSIGKIFPPAFTHSSPQYGISYDCIWISAAASVLTIIFSLLSMAFDQKPKKPAPPHFNLSYLNTRAM